ncbi:hypothetical protein D3C76_1847980 [compost metagenome]
MFQPVFQLFHGLVDVLGPHVSLSDLDAKLQVLTTGRADLFEEVHLKAHHPGQNQFGQHQQYAHGHG